MLFFPTVTTLTNDNRQLHHPDYNDECKAGFNRAVSKNLLTTDASMIEFDGVRSFILEKGLWKGRLCSAYNLFANIPRSICRLVANVSHIAETFFASVKSLFRGEGTEMKRSGKEMFSAIGGCIARLPEFVFEEVRCAAGIINPGWAIAYTSEALNRHQVIQTDHPNTIEALNRHQVIQTDRSNTI